MGNQSIDLNSYVAQLEQHSEVQAVRAKLTSVEEEEARVQTSAFISDTKRVISSSQQIAELEQSLLSRGPIPTDEQESLTRQKEEVQNEFEQMVKSAISSARSNPLTQAYARAVAAHSFNTEVIDNLPDFLPPSALASLQDVGIDPQRFRDYWNACYPKRRQAIWDMFGSAPHGLYDALKAFENSIGLEAPQITPSALTSRAYAPDLTDPLMYWGISQMCALSGKLLSLIPVVGPFLELGCIVAGCVFFGIAAWSLYNELEKAKVAEKQVTDYRNYLQDILRDFSAMAHESVEGFRAHVHDNVQTLTVQLDSWTSTPSAQQATTIIDFREKFVIQINGSRDQLASDSAELDAKICNVAKETKQNVTERELRVYSQAQYDEMRRMFLIWRINLDDNCGLARNISSSILESYTNATIELIYRMPSPYIANRNSLEVHRIECVWVSRMNSVNRVPYTTLSEVANIIQNAGYNGCFYCLHRYDSDTLTREQVVNNLTADLKH